MKSRPAARRQKRYPFEQRVFFLAVMAGLPGSFIALTMLWRGDFTPKVQWTLTVLVVSLWWGLAFALRERVVRHLQTLSNLLAALREGDYSIRARGARHDDALGEVTFEVNMLGETLREQRLGALEATELLRTVMSEIDVAIFTFDESGRLRLVNRAGERLLQQPEERLLGRGAEETGLDEFLRGEEVRTLSKNFPGAAGRWGVRRSSFREKGRPHQLVVISDLSRPLREEELQAWQRLVRVLGHELNNSLAPIKSIAGSLETLLARDPQPDDWREDMRRGLTVIGARSAALGRFTLAYARLAKLPAPRFETVDVETWVRRVVQLEMRLPVTLVPGPRVRIEADGDQLDQLLINVLRNAVDAALETGGGVRVTWARNTAHLHVLVEDEGPGLSNTSNLFVPFFTTKPEGSGIGLILSRQIAEAHGGTLTLQNRRGARGCEARLQLPL
jgi:two-component system nitrogen regulation sensor histidine kinase NtrY